MVKIILFIGSESMHIIDSSLAPCTSIARVSALCQNFENEMM